MSISWENRYNTGIEKVDNQHKKLVALINKLIDAQANRQGHGDIEQIFQGLVNYCNYHFTMEELVLQDNNYPEYVAHKNEHDIFIKKVDNFYAQFNCGNAAALFYTMDFLKDWLIRHILIEDKKYVPQMMGKF